VFWAEGNKMKRYISKLKQGGIIVTQVNAPTKEQAEKESSSLGVRFCRDLKEKTKQEERNKTEFNIRFV